MVWYHNEDINMIYSRLKTILSPHGSLVCLFYSHTYLLSVPIPDPWLLLTNTNEFILYVTLFIYFFWLLSMGSHRVGHDWSDPAAAAAAYFLPNILCLLILYLYIVFFHILIVSLAHIYLFIFKNQCPRNKFRITEELCVTLKLFIFGCSRSSLLCWGFL